MKIKFFFYSTLLFYSMVFSQKPNELNDDQRVIDSLNKVFSSTKSDSLKCIASFELSRIYLGYDLDKVKASLSISNALVKNNPYLKDISYYYNAPYNFYKSNDTKAYLKDLIFVKEKLSKYKNPEANLMRLKTLINISVVHGWQNNELESKKIQIEQAIPLAKSINNNELLGAIYLSLSSTFFNDNDLNKSDYYGNLSVKALEFKKINSTKYNENLFLAYIGYSQVLSTNKNFSEALVLLNKAYEIIKNHPNSILYCNYYYSMGLYELKKENDQRALYYVNLGIKKAFFFDDTFLQYKLELLKIEILMLQKKFIEIKDLLINVLKSDYIQSDEKRDAYKELAYVHKQLKDYYNSVIFYERYINLKDSLDNSDMKNKILDLEAKFNNSEKEKKIITLESDKEKAELENENNKLYLLLFGITIILMLSIIFFLYRNTKIQKKIALQQEINFNQNLSELKKEKEIEIMRAMINSEEEERKRIARDLHDGIGSRLSSLKMCLGQINNEEKFKNEFEYLSELLSTSIVELRQVSFNLMPETLLRLGLVSAIKDLCYTLNNDVVEIEFNSNGIKNNIAISCQIAIFRIVQELLINALKHSHCTELMIDCSQNDNLFLITIEDNGVGFNVNAINEFKGLGLKNIQNRVDLLNGKFEIVSKNNHGTSINIELIISKS
jgi:two-component system, NarL family, sensor kinase